MLWYLFNKPDPTDETQKGQNQSRAFLLKQMARNNIYLETPYAGRVNHIFVFMWRDVLMAVINSFYKHISENGWGNGTLSYGLCDRVQFIATAKVSGEW